MTLVPRVVIGRYTDGSIGLKVSLPGYDASVMADDQDSNKRAFNSQWTNLAKIAQIGTASAPNTGTIIPHSLGYVPYFEMRIWEPGSNTFYDDYCDPLSTINQNILINSGATATYLKPVAPFTSRNVVYIIFATPVA